MLVWPRRLRPHCNYRGKPPTPEISLEYEQLRRLKNTLMGAGHRLELLASDPNYSPELRNGLRSLARELRGTVLTFDQLLRRHLEELS
jgi:hypothetical protein